MAEPRTKLVDGALLCVYLALAALPVTAMLAGIRGRELEGVLTPAPLPEFAPARVLHEEFQHGFAAWFEGSLGLKGTSIALDNTILYHAFGETKPGSEVRIGEDGVLFLDQDIDYYNRHRGFRPGFVDSTAARIAQAQRLLAERGKALVPIIVPGKASVWRDKVPDAWSLDLGEPRPSDKRVYRRLVRALDAHGVRYVDMRERITTSSLPRPILFPADGRHWSDYAACLAMDDVASLYAELTGKPRPAHAGELEVVPTHARISDFDLWRLLNALFVPRAVEETPRPRHGPPPPLAPRPSILFVGSSFCRNLMQDAGESGLYGAIHYNYYNLAFETWPHTYHMPLELGTDVWREITLERDVYVLDLFEVYFFPSGHVEGFLADLLPVLQER